MNTVYEVTSEDTNQVYRIVFEHIFSNYVVFLKSYKNLYFKCMDIDTNKKMSYQTKDKTGLKGLLSLNDRSEQCTFVTMKKIELKYDESDDSDYGEDSDDENEIDDVNKDPDYVYESDEDDEDDDDYDTESEDEEDEVKVESFRHKKPLEIKFDAEYYDTDSDVESDGDSSSDYNPESDDDSNRKNGTNFCRFM
jgi:hypothetical protein